VQKGRTRNGGYIKPSSRKLYLRRLHHNRVPGRRPIRELGKELIINLVVFCTFGKSRKSSSDLGIYNRRNCTVMLSCMLPQYDLQLTSTKSRLALVRRCCLLCMHRQQSSQNGSMNLSGMGCHVMSLASQRLIAELVAIEAVVKPASLVT
jgi:hypothetical protein